MSRTTGARIFQGRDTKQLARDGKQAQASAWYYEPPGYDGDVLWSPPYPSRDAARRDAEAHGEVVS